MHTDWDDLRVVLGVYRGGSTRGARDLLGMSHATIARRIDALETRLGVRFFNRMPSGYELTPSGEELLVTAQTIESEMNAVTLKLAGRDRKLAGVIRITTLDTIASAFLMPVLARFSERYPDIEFELTLGYRSLDLRRREADIAIRGVNKPPEHLIGHRLASVAYTGYATKAYLATHEIDSSGNGRWIGFGTRLDSPQWLKHSPLPDLPVWGLFDDMPMQVEAARHGLGIAYIPCYLGDPDPDLVRVTPDRLVLRHDLWLLRHRDTRSTARLRVFSEFLTEAFHGAADLFEGRRG